MRFTVYNVETQLYELDNHGIEFLENVIQKLGIIEDMMDEAGIDSLRELKIWMQNETKNC